MLGLDKHVVPQEKKKSAKVIKVVSSEALCLRIRSEERRVGKECRL